MFILSGLAYSISIICSSFESLRFLKKKKCSKGYFFHMVWFMKIYFADAFAPRIHILRQKYVHIFDQSYWKCGRDMGKATKKSFIHKFFSYPFLTLFFTKGQGFRKFMEKQN